MHTYITNNSTRDQFLFSQAIASFKKSSISYFLEEDIYEVAINKKADYIILEDSNLRNKHVQLFIQDLTSQAVSTSSKIIILTDENKSNTNANIIQIPKKSYLSFNDFYIPQKKDTYPYIFCYLDSNNQDLSIIEPILYPQNTKIAVKIVNAPALIHPQNLGIASEKTVLDLIAGCSVFVGLAENYLYDAIRMDTPTICYTKNEFIEQNNKQLDLETLLSTNRPSTYADLNKLYKYSISNIIKHIIKP